nr:ABC transporter substrate-binding protein [Bacilli bacterium]
MPSKTMQKVTMIALLMTIMTGVSSSVSFAAVKHGKTTATKNITSTGFPLSITDEAGHHVVIKKQPLRIASTTEGTDEIVSALVPKKRLVMVTTFASQPNYSNIVSYVKGIPAINEVNAEQVLAVKPDLVLMASYNTPAIVKQIETTGTPVFEFANFNSITQIEQNITLVGRLLGAQQKAKNVVVAMKQQIAHLSSLTKTKSKITVLNYSSDSYVAGRDTTVNSIIKDANGINVASGIEGWQTITDEELIKLNPDVIIGTKDDALMVKKLMSNPALSVLSAVKHHRIYLLSGANLTSVSQYVVRGVRDVEHVLYPNVQLPADSTLE